MTAYIFARSEAARNGLQPFDPGRHIRQVAQLVSQVFADELDDHGRAALREMDFVGRLSPFIGGWTSLALFSDEIYGHVWTEDGRVVGNVTLQEADSTGLRWRISNVAVLPEYRGRGIARALMQATLREIARRAGNWAILQVRANNAGARGLYQRLRFTDVCREGVWQLPTTPAQPPELDPEAPLTPLHSLTGGEWLDLAHAARPTLAQWAEPVRASDYQLSLGRLLGEALGRWSGLYRVERWAAWEAGRLMGAVESRADSFDGTDALRLAVRPEAHGRLERALVARGLRSLAETGGRRPVFVAHSGDHTAAVAALTDAGFHIQRDLITMRRQITPDDHS